ncbi:MAG TPA: ATP-binding protein [Methanomicrobiales archaeon]|nr:ATP-binding protein [Methanomicrobiales archaeon]
MKRLSVISGKGGTGKTMITAALATILPGPRVMADCDVDASNLELLLNPRVISTRPFYGMPCAEIEAETCVSCGECMDACRFGAISPAEEACRVNPIRCEGCAVCTTVCPVEAITMKERIAGEIFYSETEWGPLSHARLEPGAGNSGLLVAEVKKQAIMKAEDRALLLIDGPPGIGCPLISTVSGTDAALIVTEPSVSALHDLERVMRVCQQFGVKTSVVINKYTLDEEITARIQASCTEWGIDIAALIPFDERVIKSIRNRQPCTLQESPAASAIRDLGAVIAEKLAFKE